MPKDTVSLAAMLLDLQGLKARQPFTDDVRPAEGEAPPAPSTSSTAQDA
jgi:hypothetical protein